VLTYQTVREQMNCEVEKVVNLNEQQCQLLYYHSTMIVIVCSRRGSSRGNQTMKPVLY
jgi:hypothetical protein